MTVNPFFVGYLLGVVIASLLVWLLLRRAGADWFGAHLRGLPAHRLRYLLGARFLRMASVGFGVDVALGGRISGPSELLLAFVFGLCGPLALLLRHRPPIQRLLVIMPLVLIIYGIALSRWHGPALPASDVAAAYRLDAFAIFVVLVASALVTTKHINVEGDRQLRAETELEAARAVQQVLIPERTPNLSRFKIESVYQPAGQVGGDFFQVLPTASGGVLIAIGDVSGKGMPAAMTVSLLVGSLRTVADFTTSPAAILSELNRRMMVRSKEGFTTCLILRADPDGTLIMANAGHLSPYCNGEELATENGLPLGLDAQSAYEEVRFNLQPGVQLTLLTDGVVEARSAAGELFGFARAQTLSCNGAEQISDAARAFGQEDDITVLTLALAPEVPASA